MKINVLSDLTLAELGAERKKHRELVSSPIFFAILEGSTDVKKEIKSRDINVK